MSRNILRAMLATAVFLAGAVASGRLPLSFEGLATTLIFAVAGLLWLARHLRQTRHGDKWRGAPARERDHP